MPTSIRLHNSKPRPGARHRVKRLGCGESSGHGKTSGKGHKGQKARSGGSIRLGFEGGQMPLIRRIPKRGFNNAAVQDHLRAGQPRPTSRLLFEAGAIDEKGLREKGLVNGNWDGVKILGGGDVTKKFSLKVNAISASAKEKIEKAGGSIELVAGKSLPRAQQREGSREDIQAGQGQGRAHSRQEISASVRCRHAHRVTRFLFPDGPRGHGRRSALGATADARQRPANIESRPS